MRQKFLSLLLSGALLISSIPDVFAADPSAMIDISGHWAEENIGWVMEQELFNGVSETEFSPNGSMTRGMFVTVLGRYAGIDPEQYRDWYLPGLYGDVAEDRYYAPYINWATRFGIANGTSEDLFSPDEPVTREQMATLILRFASIYRFDIAQTTEEIVESFTDFDTVGNFAKDAVGTMRQTGLLNGIRQEDGTFLFSPKTNATRAQCATIFRRISDGLIPGEEEVTFPESITLPSDILSMKLGETAQLVPVITPELPSVSTLTWISTDPGVATVDAKGNVTVVGSGEAEIFVYTPNGLSASCKILCATYIGSAEESYDSKCMNLFGEVVDDPRLVYETKEEAEAHMVTVPITVWDFTDSSRTEKYTKTIDLTVHENIADTVQALFREIYEQPEQFCFNYVSGYRFADKSEHTPGLAIDVNPEQNPYCDPEGNALVGKHFDPENDPYSIEIDGTVQKIFEKYGFTRGIYWRSGYKDYMHFSFFGT